MLRDGRISQHMPTLHPTSEELTMDSIQFTTFDLGGHLQVRKVWKNYFPAVDAIVFIVDASRMDRFAEAKAELDGLLMDEEIINCPILVLGNKIDLPGAVPEQTLLQYLCIQQSVTGKGKIPKSQINGRPLEVFMCSILKKHGYGEGFRWLAQYID
ncbi:hypothetical protein GJ496_008286 [Pomphorhynchus laevis]|nr:hypothetical protein GJ496_008286 [Pomphorhynchus laevis]